VQVAVRRSYFKSLEIMIDLARRLLNQPALNILLFRAPGFFTPRIPRLLSPSGRADAVRHSDAAPLKSTLQRPVNFKRINANSICLNVDAPNVRTRNLVHFDNNTEHIEGSDVIAAPRCSRFPATENRGPQRANCEVFLLTHQRGIIPTEGGRPPCGAVPCADHRPCSQEEP
jgi:hypothetical protein